MGKSRVVWAPCGEEAVRWNNADSNTAGYSRYKDDPLHVLEASIDLLELGRRIRCAREINGRSQEAFADVCRLDRSYFGEIERGEPGRVRGQVRHLHRRRFSGLGHPGCQRR